MLTTPLILCFSQNFKELSLFGGRTLSGDRLLSHFLSFCSQSVGEWALSKIISTQYGNVLNLESPVLDRAMSVALATRRKASTNTSNLVFRSNWQTISSSLLFLQTVLVKSSRTPRVVTFPQGGELPSRFSLQAASSSSTVLELSLCFYIATRYLHQPEV